MVFHSGIHYLNVSFSPTDLHSLTMYSNSTAAQIVCVGHSHITFRRFQMVRIVDLEFIGCARNRIEEIGSFELVNTIFKHGGTVLELMDTTAAGIFNSTFLSNTGNPGRGVLLFQRSKVDIEASTFLNNSASGVAYGGVISSYASTVTMTMSEFDQSSAQFGRVISTLFGDLRVEACTFRNSSAQSHGAVLFSDHSHITIDASEFDGNSASRGGQYFTNSNVTIKNSQHINNRVIYGAGIYSSKSDVRIEANYFANNSGTLKGGGIYSFRSNLTIKGTEFIGNRAISMGAVLYSDRSNITLGNSTAENNTAAIYRVVYSRSYNIKIEASVFNNNVGGVKILSGGRISIRKSHFDRNVAESGDGGVFVINIHESISVDASEFTENSAEDGGVLSCTCRNISITRCQFNKNTATQKGGALIFHQSNVRMGDCSFTNNNSTIA